MILAHHGILKGGAVFNPSDLSPDYFNEDLQTFTGSNYVNTGIYNSSWRQDYWHVFVKVAPDDGQPVADEILFGARTAITVQRIVLRIIANNGRLRFQGGAYSLTTGVGDAFGNGPQPYMIIRRSGGVGSEDLYMDNILVKTGNVAIPNNQTSHLVYYGAYNYDGVATNHFSGTSKAFFVWGGAVDLTSQNLTDLTNWFSNK